MDEVGLDEAIEAEAGLKADILVFPHHGGLPGAADAEEFTEKLLNAVRPNTVVFSNGRGRHDNPRPAIVDAVRNRGCTVACTQLSERCQSKPVDARDYLEPLRASGRKMGASCAGSMTLELQPRGHRPSEFAARHQSFISERVASPMCRYAGKSLASDDRTAGTSQQSIS
jgi:competence protein ComEC